MDAASRAVEIEFALAEIVGMERSADPLSVEPALRLASSDDIDELGIGREVRIVTHHRAGHMESRCVLKLPCHERGMQLVSVDHEPAQRGRRAPGEKHERPTKKQLRAHRSMSHNGSPLSRRAFQRSAAG
jgi:hypothetical protein